MDKNYIALGKELSLALIYFGNTMTSIEPNTSSAVIKAIVVLFLLSFSDIRYYAEKINARLIFIYAADLIGVTEIRRIGAAEALGELFVFRHGVTHEVEPSHLFSSLSNSRLSISSRVGILYSPCGASLGAASKKPS